MKNTTDSIMPMVAPISIDTVGAPSLNIDAKLPRKVIEKDALLKS